MSTGSDRGGPPLAQTHPDSVVSVVGLGKRYRLGAQPKVPGFKDYWRDAARAWRRRSDEDTATIWALDRVSFEVGRGERIGIIGRNGAGKSTLLKILSRVSTPSVGEARIRGRLTSLLEVGTGFNDNLTGRENVFLNASLYGLSREEVRDRFDRIVAFSEVARFIDTPVKAYSSGMKMRLAFAVAAHLDPDILLLDEVLAVGDMAFQQKCLEKVDDMTSGGRTLFFVSHSMDAVIRYCDRCIWLDRGRIRMDGGTTDVVNAYVDAVLGVRSRIGAEPSAAAEPPATAEGPTASDEPVAAEATPVEAPAAAEAVPAFPDAASVEAGAAVAEIAAAEPVAPDAEDVHAVMGAEATAFLRNGWVGDRNGAERTVIRVDEPVCVYFEYAVTAPGFYMPAIHLHCPQGTLAFASCPTDIRVDSFRAHDIGTFRAVVEVPPHLLNIGTYRVSLIVFSPDESPFKRHFTAEQALAFHCVEAAMGKPSARGLMPRGFPGPVRPMLDWRIETVGEPGSLRSGAERAIRSGEAWSRSDADRSPKPSAA